MIPYCSIFGKFYAVKHTSAILDSETITAGGVKSLLFYTEKSLDHTFIDSIDKFIFNFWPVESKFRELLQSPDIDDLEHYRVIKLYERHLNLILSRYGIISSDSDRRNDVLKLIEIASPFELHFLDRFVKDYGRVRGLFYRSNFGDIRNEHGYHSWVQQVKLRDNFTCRKCGSTERIIAHHITPVNIAPELATDINNGIALCDSCHKKYHRRVSAKSCNVENLQSFISDRMRKCYA